MSIILKENCLKSYQSNPILQLIGMDCNDLFKYTFQNFQVFMWKEEDDYSSLVLGYRVETLLTFLYIITMIFLK